MKHYCNLSLVSSSVKGFTEKPNKLVESLGFADLLKLLGSDHGNMESNLDESNLDSLIECFDPSTEVLTLSDGAQINLRTQIKKLLPVPCGPYKFKCHRIKEREKFYKKRLYSYVKQRYGFDPNEYGTCKITLSDLWLDLRNSGSSMSEGEFCIKFSLAFANSFLDPLGNKKVDLGILPDLVPFERIKTLDWGNFLVDRLVIAKQSPSRKFMKGCVYLFHRAEVLHKLAVDLNSPTSVGNGGAFSGSTAVCHPESTHSSRHTHHTLVAELKNRRDILEDVMDLIEESPRFAGEEDASSMDLDEDASLMELDEDGDNGRHERNCSALRDEQVRDAAPLEVEEGDSDHVSGQSNGVEDDRGRAAQPPASFVAAPQDQIRLDDNHGNNQPLLGAAAGEGNENAGRVVIQDDDPTPKGNECRRTNLMKRLKKREACLVEKKYIDPEDSDSSDAEEYIDPKDQDWHPGCRTPW